MARAEVTSKSQKGSLWGISSSHHRVVAENCALGTKAPERTAAPVWGTEAATPPMLPFGDPYPAEGPTRACHWQEGKVRQAGPGFLPNKKQKGLCTQRSRDKECGPWSPWCGWPWAGLCEPLTGRWAGRGRGRVKMATASSNEGLVVALWSLWA